MRDISDFMRFVLPHATACPEPIAQDAILKAAREFCQATRCWREQDSFTVKGHEVEIMCVPPMSVLLEIEEAKFDGNRLERVHVKDVDLHDHGTPRYITQTQTHAVRLAPRGPGRLSISMFLQPSLDADVLPLFMFDMWADKITAGALAHVLVIPDQPFTNLQLAAYHAGIFQQAKDSSFNASLRGQQRAPTRTRSRFL